MQIRSILLPTDFSDCAAHAREYAASFARSAGASLVCLHVVEPVSPAVGYTGLGEPLPVADLADELQDTAARELPKIAGCPEFAGLSVEEVIAHGEVAAEIVRVARERGVDLIVIATHGRTGLGRMLFGSTAEAVVRHAPCPVLVVKPPDKSGQ
jgi:nucleotide-binding universal stress UspA family protein